MIVGGAVAAFALGLRHGADPDHLAAIDNVTRGAFRRTPLLSRFAGTLFALGHSVMVLAIAALVGLAGARFPGGGAALERIGGWTSVAVLLAIALVNARGLLRGEDRLRGARTRLLPRGLRDGANVLLAIPIGLLFGLGFETSSQIATYTMAFGADAGIAGALVVGSTFCVGMVCTDTLDSVLVHRLLAHRSVCLPRIMRIWAWSVTVLAMLVAAYEAAQLLGWRSPLPDLAAGLLIVAALLAVFVYAFLGTRRPPVLDPLALAQGDTP